MFEVIREDMWPIYNKSQDIGRKFKAFCMYSWVNHQQEIMHRKLDRGRIHPSQIPIRPRGKSPLRVDESTEEDEPTEAQLMAQDKDARRICAKWNHMFLFARVQGKKVN